MKAWITKYALTAGVFEVAGEVTVSGCLRYESGGYACYACYAFGNDWHSDRASAIARAEEMKIRKLQSLDRQIKKVSALKFD
jgi:hypothetical protein